MADVLLIAARKDFYTASRMQEILRAHGLESDFQDFVTGETVDLEGRIAGKSTIVFFWSEDAGKAEIMRRKIGAVALALATARVLVVRLDGSELPLGLRDIESVATDWGPRPRRDDYEALARTIATLAAPGAKPHLAPSAAPPAPSAPARTGRSAMLILTAVGIAFAGVVVIGYIAVRSLEEGRPWGAWGGQGGSSQTIPMLALLGTVAAGGVGLSRRRRKDVPASDRAAPAEAAAESTTAKPADVFISYSRKDAAFAGELVKALEKAGHSVWIDTSAASDARYAGPIVRALRSCRTVALLCSKSSFGSDHVMRELYLAGDFKKPLVAVQLDGTTLPDDFMYFLTGFPRIEAATRRAAEIASEIRSFIAARGA